MVVVFIIISVIGIDQLDVTTVTAMTAGKPLLNNNTYKYILLLETLDFFVLFITNLFSTQKKNAFY